MKTIAPDQLDSVVKPDRGETVSATHGPRVVASGNSAVPFAVLHALDALLPSYRLHLLNASGPIPDRDGVLLESTFVGSAMRRSPRLVYIPSRLSMVPLLYGAELPVDIVVAHTSMPYDGKVSLGTEVTVMPAAIEACKAADGLVIAQVNPQMPYTFGDGEYDVDTFDALVEVDAPLAVVPPAGAGSDDPADAIGGIAAVEAARVIGALVAERISDGATIQMGIGEIPDAALGGLLPRRGLGVWSEMLGTGVMALHDDGALDPDRMLISSFVFGSADLYRWVHRNRRVRVLRTETTNSPANIAANPAMTSINTALQVDLYDQANAARMNSRIYSGFGGQTDFTVGAIHSAGGQALMALRSWHRKANVSTIVPLLDEPATSFQHTAVITENGVACMRGCDQRRQAANLIEQAAHPRVRADLWEEARALGLA